MTTDTLVVSEVFGPTVQGEGPSTGRAASFIRLGGCNLHCSWCDTAYTWDARRFDLRAELRRRPVDDLVAEVLSHPTGLVIVTGGEPLLHQSQPGWRRLLLDLSNAGREVEIETNGTLAPSRPTGLLARCIVSPKLAHAGDPESARIVPAALAAHVAADAVFKFVVQSSADLDEIAGLVERFSIEASRVWVMPEGITVQDVILTARRLADAVIAHGWNLSLRSHVLLWPHEPRGR